MKTVDLSIVIPVYNEPDNIKLAIKAIRRDIKTKKEIIVVYDHKNDTTLAPLRQLKKKYKNIVIAKNNIIPGPSGAIRTGFNKAKAEKILVTMSDLCDDWKIVDKICKSVPKKYDIITPSRYTRGGGEIVNSKYKALFPRTVSTILRILTGIKTSDPTNSYKLYSSELLKNLNLKSTVSFSVTLEIVAKSHILNKRIKEVPTVWHDRQHGKTNFKIIPSLITYTPWFCLALLRNRLFTFPQSIIKKAIS